MTITAFIARTSVPSVLLTLLAACGGGDHAAPASTPGPTIAVLSDSSTREKAIRPAPSHFFTGKLADYTISRTGSTILVTEKADANTAVTVADASRLQFADMMVVFDPLGPAAQGYRLYQAAFDRVPDVAGLGFHIAAMEDSGVSLTQVAQNFVDSAEFKSRYGALDNTAFLTQLYQNILHRSPDPAGLTYWLGLLDAKALSRGEVLMGFADSRENTLLVAPAIANGIVYTPYTSDVAGTASTLSSAKIAWNAPTKLEVVLRDARGHEVPSGSLSCTAASGKLTVSADCSSAMGQRLGSGEVVVRGGGVRARLALQVIPQRKPFGTAGYADHFSSMVTPAGNALGWGYNASEVMGQGLPSVRTYNFPRLVKNAAGDGVLAGVAATSASTANAMALLESGEVVGWSSGRRLARQGTLDGLPIPVRNTGNDGNLRSIVQFAVGSDSTVALADDGRVMSWGFYHGQGTREPVSYPNLVKHPSGSGELTDIVQVASGDLFSLALSSSGKVYGWGWNKIGQLGRGVSGDVEVLPAAVVAEDGTELSDIVAISAGYDFCLALNAEGKVYAWGSNRYGKLSKDHTDAAGQTRAVLVKDSAGTGVLNKIVMISAGGNHALAIDDAGRVISWGSSAFGQLGEGAARKRVGPYRPGFVVGVDGTGTLEGIVAIAAGHSNSYALRGDGTVLAWGSAYGDALGRGDDTASSPAVPKSVRGLFNAESLMLTPAGYQNLWNRGR